MNAQAAPILVSDWPSFEEYMKQKEHQDEIQGLSYMISGGLAVIAGTSGYFSATSSVSRSFFALAQTIGVIGVGYGAQSYYLGNGHQSFYLSVKNSNLTPEQRNQILNHYLILEKKRHDQARWIQVGTHSLIALVNLYTASRETDESVKNLLGVVAATNIVMAVTYSFD